MSLYDKTPFTCAGGGKLGGYAVDTGKPCGSSSNSFSCSHGCRATAAALAKRGNAQDGSSQVMSHAATLPVWGCDRTWCPQKQQQQQLALTWLCWCLTDLLKLYHTQIVLTGGLAATRNNNCSGLPRMTWIYPRQTSQVQWVSSCISSYCAKGLWNHVFLLLSMHQYQC